MANEKCIDVIHDMRNTLCSLLEENENCANKDAIKKLKKEVENLWVICLDCSKNCDINKLT
jgi:hypothetical protein